MADTPIEWTDKVWNPVTGCHKISPGCKNCYAESIARRLWATQYPHVLVNPLPDQFKAGATAAVGEKSAAAALETAGGTRPRRFEDVQTHPDRLGEPLKWKKPARVFVNSMSDLFEEDVPFEFIDHVFAVMALAQQHTFQVLTKRAKRMRDYFATGHPWQRIACRAYEHNRYSGMAAHVFRKFDNAWPLPNVWLGVSAENQKYADERIPHLLNTPAAIRFVSAEPLLGPLDLTRWLNRGSQCDCGIHRGTPDGCEPARKIIRCNMALRRLDWVIPGGESGRNARSTEVQWLIDLVKQCAKAGTACFVKQVGARPIVEAGRQQHWEWRRVKRAENERFSEHAPYQWRVHLNDRKGGDFDEFPDILRVRQYPKGAACAV